MPVRLPYGGWFLAHGDAMGLGILWGGLTGRLYEAGSWRFVAGLLRPGDTFFDLGANQGFHTILGSRLVGMTGRVFAFEPAPTERARLRRNLWLNRCRNVLVDGHALGAREGVTDFFLCLEHQGSLSSLRPPGLDATARRRIIRVPVTTLDAYVHSRGITTLDLIKIDVEGGELDVLRGAPNVLNTLRPIIMCEMEDARTEPWGYRAKGIYTFLESQHGYRWFDVTERGRLLPADARDTFGQWENLVAVPEGKLAQVKQLVEKDAHDPVLS